MIAGFIKKDTINLLFEGLAGVCTQLRRERESLILWSLSSVTVKILSIVLKTIKQAKQ